jgi:putative hydrolase of the HAD superfamily
MAKRYETIFFDVGYTLVEIYPSVPEIMLRALKEIGIATSDEQLQAAWDAGTRKYAQDNATATFEPTEANDRARELRYRRQLLVELGIQSETRARQLFERENAIYDEPGTVRLYAETREALDRLRTAGYRLGIISNWGWNLRARCRQVGIADYFELILASAYAGCYKPNPAIFKLALDSMKVSPGRALHVGDDYRADVLGATGAGLDAVLVYRQEGHPYDCSTIHNLLDLFPLLERE